MTIFIGSSKYESLRIADSLFVFGGAANKRILSFAQAKNHCLRDGADSVH